MRRGVTNLLAGILLLAIGGYFGLSALGEWKPFWRSQDAASAKRAPARSFDPTSGDAMIHSAASQKAYGPLASAADVPSAEDDETAPSASAPAVPSGPAPVDHVVVPEADAPRHFLHKRFTVNGYHGFEFIVPAHVIDPQLHGKFRAGRAVELLLLNPQELSNFAGHQPGTATFSTEASNDGEVNWMLNSPIFEAQKYYLIFHSASHSSFTVNADFIVSWE